MHELSASLFARPTEGRSTHSMPCPCHAVPLRLYNVSFPLDLHSATVSDSHLPRRAPTMPFFSRLPARVRLLPASTRSFTKHTNPPHNDPYLQLYRVAAAQYKKDDLLNCWTSSSDISGYHADLHEGHGIVGAGQGRGMARVN